MLRLGHFARSKGMHGSKLVVAIGTGSGQRRRKTGSECTDYGFKEASFYDFVGCIFDTPSTKEVVMYVVPSIGSAKVRA